MSETSKMIGHKSLFNDFIYLDQIQKFPNKILLNGSKGIGKKLFVNHFLNFFYLKGNKQSYNLKNYEYNLSNDISKLISSIAGFSSTSFLILSNNSIFGSCINFIN